MLYLWVIYQLDVTGPDTCSSAIVCAETATDAMRIHPCFLTRWEKHGDEWVAVGHNTHQWVTDIASVNVSYLGIAGPDIQAGLVLAALN